MFSFTIENGDIKKISMKFPRTSRNSSELIRLYNDLLNTKILYREADLNILLNSIDNYINAKKKEEEKIKINGIS